MPGLPVNPTVNAASPAPSPAHAMTPHRSMPGVRFCRIARPRRDCWLLSLHYWWRKVRWAVLLLALGYLWLTWSTPVVRAESPRFDTFATLPNSSSANAVVLGDFNGDGRLDVVVGAQQSHLYLNQGTGHFPQDLPFGASENTTSLATGDFNNDGMLDLVATTTGMNAIYLNQGEPNTTAGLFAPAIPLDQPVANAAEQKVVVGDFNGDGALDVVVSGQDTPSVLYLNHNDGTGTFAAGRLVDGSLPVSSMAVGDLNGDGALDLVFGLFTAKNRIYFNKNNGSGDFEPAYVFGGAVLTVGLGLADLNGDERLDLVVGNDNQGVIYLNDGTGQFPTQEVNCNAPPTNATCFSTVTAGSIMAGDVNGDGAMDLVVGDQPIGPQDASIQYYLNVNDGSGRVITDTVLTNSPFLTSLAMGDLNADGLLDLVVSNRQSPSQLYLNQGGVAFAAGRILNAPGAARSIATGDLNSDGALDLVISQDIFVNNGVIGQGQIYRGDGKGGFTEAFSPFGAPSSTNRAIVADLNGDGKLDLVASSPDAGLLYLNDGSGTFSTAVVDCLAPPVRVRCYSNTPTEHLAVGDLDGNGTLDVLATTPLPGPDHLYQPYRYLNQGDGTFRLGEALGEPGGIVDIALGDLDNDGALDVVIAYREAQAAVYRNNGLGDFTARTTFGDTDFVGSMALGDLNGDGALDLVIGKLINQNKLYLNDGSGNFGTGLAFGDVGYAQSTVLGDLTGDGALDLVFGNGSTEGVQLNTFYLNDGTGHFAHGVPFGRPGGATRLALGDFNGDGTLDLAAGFPVSSSELYLNHTRLLRGLPNNPPTLTIRRPLGTDEANFYSTPEILSARIISIPYTLTDKEAEAVGQINAFYSLNGGGQWRPAIAASGTQTTNLRTDGTTYIFYWDTFASGFFGQSDNVVVRLEARTAVQQKGTAGAFRYPHLTPYPLHYPYAAATTFPFRVRGTQVRVVDQAHKPLAGALVYRLLAGQFSGATPLADAGGQPFRTDAQGYLGGRGALQVGDGLVALLPMTPTHPLTFTQQYSYFLTSAPPNINGLTLTELSQAGVVTLTVPTAPLTNTHPLMLFNLTVSLEWDASGDDLFQAELENGFKRASELLFKVTHGQAALNRVDVFPAKSFWNRADLILYANNSLRPSAAIGGVVKAPIGEIVRPAFDQPATKSIANAYLPGQIRMGVSWDPFGEEAGDLSEQWWRALAHELSHHLFFLLDDYVGFKTSGTTNQRFLGRVDCQGSFMTTTFDPSYTRFLDRRFWTGDCEKTIAAFSTGRNDWETIKHFYPMLKAPPNDVSFKGVGASVVAPDGPNLLPLDVTHLVFWQLPDRRPTLPARYFQLRDERKKEIIRLPTARVYLFQTQGNADPTDDVLLALGSPTGGGDRIKVRGGQPDDRLCLFDFGASDGQTYTGCIGKLSAADVSIPVRALYPVQTGVRWAPAIDVGALTTRTLVVTVTQTLPISTRLNVQVFPAHYPSAPGLAPVAALTLTQGVYVGQVALPYPASDVSVRVWVDDGTNLEAISQFNLQLPWKPGDSVMAGPNTMPMGGPNTMPMGGPNTMPMGGTDHPVVGGAPHYRFAAPALSADAQVVIYNAAGIFEPNGIQSLQILPSPPEVEEESWLVPVGQAYFVQPDPTLAAKRAIAITYLQRDVPEGYEHTLTIYYLRQGDKSWQRLATQQFVENLLVADLQVSAGTYAVMSTVMLPALSSGLNLVTYPLPDTRPITTALASLAGQYSNLYEVGPNGKLLLAPQQLVFGHTYVIQIESKEPVYLYLAPPRRLPNGGLPGEP